MKKNALSLALALVMCLGLTLPASAIYEMGKAGERNLINGGALIDANNTLWTWGANPLGIQGSSSIPVRGLDNILSICEQSVYNGGSHSAIIKSDNTLWLWGSDSSYAIGLGTGKYYVSPVKVLDHVAAVSCGPNHTAAVKTDGTLWMWGWNAIGQLGNGGVNNHGDYQTVPVKVMDDVAAVSCGTEYTAAIKTDGTLWMWGMNRYGQLGNGGSGNTTNKGGGPIQTVPTKIMDNVAAVSCGTYHTAALKTDGTLWTWGENFGGYLGTGSTESSAVPVKVMDNVKAVCCGESHTAAIKTDGTLWTWGTDYGHGWLGTGGSGNATDNSGRPFQTVPVKVLDNAAAVSCGKVYTAAIKADGSLWRWGNTLDDGLQMTNSNVPVKVNFTMSVPTQSQQPTTPEKPAGPAVDNWAKDRVAVAQANKLVPDGLDDDYRVNITRAQFAAVAVKLYEAMGGKAAPAAGSSPFSDTSDPVILQAADLGFVSGVGDGKFGPDSLVTREQMAVMLSKVYTRLGGSIPTVTSTSFADDGAISGWARSAVAFMNGKDILSGKGGNKFAPKGDGGNAKIEEALLVSLKMLETLK